MRDGDFYETNHGGLFSYRSDRVDNQQRCMGAWARWLGWTLLRVSLLCLPPALITICQ